MSQQQVSVDKEVLEEILKEISELKKLANNNNTKTTATVAVEKKKEVEVQLEELVCFEDVI
jgi:hypothetical protein